MTSRLVAAALGLLVGTAFPFALSAPVLAVPEEINLPGEIILAFRESPGRGSEELTETPWPEVNALFAEFGVEVARPLDRGEEPTTYRIIRNSSVNDEDAIHAFSELAQVRYAEPNFLVRTQYSPDDPLYNQQWNFTKVNASEAWEYDLVSPSHGGDPGIVVAVVDTGVAYEGFTDPNPAFCFTGGDEDGNCVAAGAVYARAPDFSSGSFVAGYDFVNDDSHPNDDNGHGTHVASTIAEATDNGVGAAGLAFATSLMPVKVIARDGLGTTSMIAQGIDFARENGADVINLSVGTVSNSQILSDAITNALNAGIIVAAASGNSAQSSLLYPARYSGVIGVGATANTVANTLASYSNWGSGIDVVAPGGDGGSSIIQQGFTNLDGNDLPNDFTTFGYVGFQGTSMATPHVSAAAALLLAAGAPRDEVLGLLQSSARDLGDAGYDLVYGYGLVDIAEAIHQAGVDTATPRTRLTVSPSAPNGSHGYYKTRPTLTLEATDDRSGVDSIWYSWDNGDPVEYTEPFTAPNGEHTLRYYAYDVAGHREPRHAKTLLVDASAPRLNIDEGIHNRTKTERRLVVSGSVADGISGLAAVTVNGWAASIRNGRFSARVTLEPGVNTIRIQARDRAGRTRNATASVRLRGTTKLLSAGRPGALPLLRQYQTSGKLLRSFAVFPETFRGGVSVASGDVDGDGRDEVIVSPESGGGPQVRILSTSGQLERQFFAYDSGYRGGLSLAACDLDNDGRDEIVVGTSDSKAPHVRVFSGKGRLLRQFFAYAESSRFGARVACGNVTGDGKPEIVTVPAGNAAPHVRIFSSTGRALSQFFALESHARLSLSLAVADVDGDGAADIATVPRHGAPQVRLFSGTGKVLTQFFAFDPAFRGGASLQASDVDGNGRADFIVGAGPGGGPQLRVFSGKAKLLYQFFTQSARDRNGIIVGFSD